MPEASFKVKYDGPGLAGHAMDVQDLAPALLAIGDMCREANRLINGNDTTVDVLIAAAPEHGSFIVTLSAIQTVLDTAQQIVGNQYIHTIKEILEWLGLLGIPVIPGAIATTIGYLRVKNGRPVESVTKPDDADNRGRLSVQFRGDGNAVTVNQNAYFLGENGAIAGSVGKVFEPVQRPRIDNVQFGSERDEWEVYGKDDAERVVKSSNPDMPLDEPTVNVMETWLRIYAPKYDAKAETWWFLWMGTRITADITLTSLAQDSLEAGGVPVGTAYRVKLQIRERGPNQRADYKVLEVLETRAGRANEQTQIEIDDDSN
ncbi:MAG TPA: hypothetical protein VKB51_14590 [bacterium]|nr:hypothetical protein [bacterium]